ncbi:MAG: PorT family protein [Mucilaginibacter sp.]|nr:PorT family protein [Mucilaginibacter sp.]
MKKSILFLFLLVASQFVIAQSVQFGIKGGLNLATADRGTLPSGTETKNLARFDAGVFANIGFANWSIEPGLFYSQKGFKGNSTFTSQPQPGYEIAINNYKVEATVNYNYLELPVNILYNVKIAPGKIFFGGGPYIGYLLSGKYKVIESMDGTFMPEQKGNYSIGDNGLKRTDFGINGIAGFAFNYHFQLSAGYSYGFTNIINGADSGVKNRVFNVSVGYSL